METVNNVDKVRKKKSKKQTFIIIAAIVVVVLILAFIFGEKTPNVKETDATSITADEISEKFLHDKEGTDKEFQNKVYEITGYVKKVNAQYSITLSTESGEYEIYFDIDSNKSNKIPELEKGDIATVRGLYNGVLANRIDFKNCLYISSEKVGIEKIEFSDNDTYGFKEIGETKKAFVELNTSNFTKDDLEIIVQSEEIATVEFDEQKGNKMYFIITAKSGGSTGFSIQTKDGKVKTVTNKRIVVDRKSVDEIDKEVANDKATEEQVEVVETENITHEYAINYETGKFHKPGCYTIEDADNIGTYTGTKEELENQGYEACKKCKPR